MYKISKISGLLAIIAMTSGNACTHVDDEFNQVADPSNLLSEIELQEILSGKTLYIRVPPGGPGGESGGLAPFKYGADGSAAALLPTGIKLVGEWRLSGSSYCVDWANGPKNSCSGLMKTAVGHSIIDLKTNTSRGQVERVIIGNPEGL